MRRKKFLLGKQKSTIVFADCIKDGIKYIAMGHNTVRGAAGASVLNAEMMLSRGLL